MTSKRRKQRGKPPTEDIEEETANSTTDQSNKKSKRNDALAFVDEVKASMQNKGQCTFNESSEVLQIEPLPQIHGKRSKIILQLMRYWCIFTPQTKHHEKTKTQIY